MGYVPVAILEGWGLAGGAPALAEETSRFTYFEPTVILFLGATSAIPGIFFGLTPAVQSLRTDMQTVLKSGAGTISGMTMRAALVVLEIAMTMTLLIGAGISAKSFVRVIGGKCLPLIADRANTSRFNVPGSPLINPDALPGGQIRTASAQRTREIGTRMALGAQRQQMLAPFMGYGLKLALLGLVCGLTASFVLRRTLANLVYGVSAGDPGIYLSVSTLMLLVALIACYIPARKAAKVDPLASLNYE